MKKTLLIATAAVLAASAAHAQEPAPAAPAAPAASAAAPATFTDAELTSFAKAAIAASKIQQDTAVPADQKQPMMLAAVQAEGLEPAKFNAIAQASNADPALKKRIETVASAAMAPAEPAATPAP